MERLIRQRRACPEVGWGAWRVLEVDQKAVLGLRYDWDDRIMLTLHNLSSKPCRATLMPGRGDDWQALAHQFGRGAHDLRRDGSLTAELESYGSLWLRVRRAGDQLRL